MKTHCVICRLFNAAREYAIHPSRTSSDLFLRMWQRSLDREPKAIATIPGCSQHNLPFHFIVCMSQLGNIAAAVRMGLPEDVDYILKQPMKSCGSFGYAVMSAPKYVPMPLPR